MSKEFVVGITGASGGIYGVRLVQELAAAGHLVHLLLTNASWQVFREELQWNITAGDRSSIPIWFKVDPASVQVHDMHDYRAPVASGSHHTDGMVIIPCSMGTLSAIAHGASDNLLERAADTALKEGRTLVVVPRETPMNAIHLRNMLMLAEAGARILPAMPGFYHLPQTIDDLVDFVVGKVLDALRIDHNLFRRWGE
ncbi:UbiX family flavin prenyltransferase [Effusibacillus lacus]|uniref:Flavin prenyltransferase UbiX n=1 Tax=Effusibacillus lacus TaxID=1348429 RepID=A0A292YD24_9BACL|nr:flavin prenyltransferase UbiX [Effusibacillus lacus]TCS75284.1 4-hydroxy-3-polyprenylbenzoate decarboxylase [Effusibacillus lacus]GAX89722.1 aromatic acid decarboxylase [Effusibacillus lacus]